MKHRITAAIAAAAIALTAAAPVRADSNDALKLALGAVGVGLLVHELDKKNREEAATVVDDRWSDDWTSRNRYDDSFRKKGKIIPAQCIFDGKIRQFHLAPTLCPERLALRPGIGKPRILGDGVPRPAGIATPGPFRVDGAAGGADEGRLAHYRTASIGPSARP